MKKLLNLVFPVFLMAACVKSGTNTSVNCDAVTLTAPASEVATLRAYLDTNNIIVTEDSRGFFYHIDSVGSGAKPGICNAVIVDYAGYLLNGATSFGQGSNATFNLNALIIGWQEAIPLMAAGSRMSLYLPPSLAYGSQGSGTTIPPDAYLRFTIALKSVN